MAQPIQILVSNQRGFIWDIRGTADAIRSLISSLLTSDGLSRTTDVQTLRVQHHICGILSGTLPQVGQQNVFLGLPLMLLPEEVVLLVKNSQLDGLRRRPRRLANTGSHFLSRRDCRAGR